ncbi:DUF2491 family protein [Thiospirillum jenense]|uniref:DUF2491 family protein n=1 Tax=Thiospirillum jenense TaxID=1653858 RepID=A0A839HJ37_9GAMM|nr:DUF2491 family protein [Thiospirillum jenense]MBB1126659.1 DUF2491 family protein [Thiospirillum jenense]
MIITFVTHHRFSALSQFNWGICFISLIGLVLYLAPIDDSWARGSSGSKSSGGYSRSSSFTRSRTPSTRSKTDRTLARQNSASALDRFDSAVAAVTKARTPSTAPSLINSFGGSNRTPSFSNHSSKRSPKIELDFDLELPSNNYSGGAPIANAVAGVASGFARFLFSLILFGGLVLLVIGLVIYLIWRHRRAANNQSTIQQSPTRTAASQLPARPAGLRVGMTIPIDPSAFILAAPYTAIQTPEAATSSGLLSVTAVSTVTSDTLNWQRLYLTDDEQQFFQLHFDENKQPDECRYFSLLDEVTPSNEDEWSFWLDQYEGVIGWPDFQTKDGQLYQRVWAAGDTRIAPRILDETLDQTDQSQLRRRLRAMLYARDTNAMTPAPPVEYLLVAAIKQNNTAWVTLHVGIDIQPAALQLK